tara:strand:- start:514 stop:1104 length:591 start_codon:yes stop_codon:yes gene_type:complete
MSNVFIEKYFNNFSDLIKKIDIEAINKAIEILKELQNKKGRLFILGVGGSAGNASHSVNDFRKLCNIETYTPTDNISEITARTNDEGFQTIFEEYLKVSKLSDKDVLLILSVGGGNESLNISTNLIRAIKYAKSLNSNVISIVGKNDGYAYENSDCSILVSPDDKLFLTPISESMQVVIWHLLVSHPDLKINHTKW